MRTEQKREDEMTAKRCARLWRGVLDVLPQKLAVLDAKGAVTAVNGRWDELEIGTDYLAFCRQAAQSGKPTAAEALRCLEAVLRGETDEARTEYPCDSTDSEDNWFLMRVLRPPAHVGGAIVSHTDITARKRAEEALRRNEERFRTFFESLGVGAVQFDSHTHLTRVNDRYCQITGYTRDELLKKTVFDLDHPDDCEADRRSYARLLAGKTPIHVAEKRYVRKDGTIAWVHVTAAVVRDDRGEIVHVAGTVEDITERKRAEEQLQLTADELERSNQDLEQFAYFASHDLKEPLGVINLYLGLLKKKYATILDEKAVEIIAHATNASKRMSQLINDLLAFSRVGRKTEGFTRMGMSEALAGAMGNLRAALEGSGAMVTHDPLPMLMADKAMMTQLLQNLVGNAIKYAAEGVRPVIHIAARREQDVWKFSVRDNGQGVPSEDHQRVFVMFQRGRDHRRSDGTGIGLAICKKIVEHHGGRIWVESPPEGGSTFCFTLPNREG